MSKVGNWLIEMQEYAYYLLGYGLIPPSRQLCREMFLEKYPGQDTVFDQVEKEWENR